jgi:Zn-dependent protease
VNRTPLPASPVLHFSGLSFLEAVLPGFAILLFSLSFHEAAHAVTADRLGDSTARRLGRVTLNPLAHIDWIGTVLFPLIAMLSNFPLIGWAKPVPVNPTNLRHPRRDFAVVALAGPVSNVILAVTTAIVFLALSGPGGRFSGPPMLEILMINMVVLNLLLAVFNMLPVPPLDGGNVLAGMVPESVALTVDRLRPYGMFILYGLMLSGVFTAIFRPISNFVYGMLLR